MSYPAIKISISRLARMSPAQLRAMDAAAMGLPAPVEPVKPARPALRHIEIDDIPNAAQAALVSMSFDNLCKAVSARLKSSTIRFGLREFTLLRELGLAERKPDSIYHRLTSDGKGYAVLVARQIAKTLGLHEIWTEPNERFGHCTVHCTCGWSDRLYSSKLSASRDHNNRIARHLGRAAGTWKEPGTQALDRAIQSIGERFGGGG